MPLQIIYIEVNGDYCDLRFARLEGRLLKEGISILNAHLAMRGNCSFLPQEEYICTLIFTK